MSITAMNKPKPFTGNSKLLRVLLRVILAGVLIIAGIFVWALLSTGSNLVARGIMWGDSDVGDLQRFPSRTFAASSNPVIFRKSSLPQLDDLTIADKYSFDDYLEQTGSTAFIILHGDEILYEGYFNGSSRESLQSSMSVAKSFTSTLVGIAIEEGYIGGLDDPVTKYIPELAERDARFADITLRHLITMSSGLQFERSEATPIDDGFISYYAPDLRQAALDSSIVEAPGSSFLYNDYNPQLLGMVLENATGMSVSEYMETRLWQPMGAEGDGSWSLDSERSGFEKMSVGVNGRAIDLAKLGWLFLNEGRNGDQQVVPSNWVEEATRVDTTTDPSAGYQYYWWIDEEHHAFWAEGDYCQYVYVYPDADLVMVRTGSTCGDEPNFGPDLLRNLAAWLAVELSD